jgi:putative transposase
MRQHGIEGKLRGSKKRTTIPGEAAVEKARDLLQRDFSAEPPEPEVGLRPHLPAHLERLPLPSLRARLLLTDDRGLAARDAHAHRTRARRARDGQRSAPSRRRADAHSDRGSQYTSIRYTDRLDELGAAPSVGSRGDAYDCEQNPGRCWVLV